MDNGGFRSATKGTLVMLGRAITIALLIICSTRLAHGRDYMASLTEGEAIELRDAEDRVAATVAAGEKFVVVQPTLRVKQTSMGNTKAGDARMAYFAAAAVFDDKEGGFVLQDVRQLNTGTAKKKK